MSRFDALRARMRLIIAPRAAESRADEEIRFHLEMETERLVRDERLDPAEAERRARAAFGGVAQHKETLRPARWFDSVAADVRFAFRFFARKPLSSVTIVLVLALGIAGYAAVFGLMQSATVRPPPGVPDSVPLVRLRGMVRQKEQPSWSLMRFSYPELRDMTGLRTIFSAVTAWTENDVVADMPGVLDHAKARVQFVTDGYFSVVGLRLARGSALPAAGAGASAESQFVGVISDAMWEDVFARKDVMNRTVMVNGVGVRIVGVAPPQFVASSHAGSRQSPDDVAAAGDPRGRSDGEQRRECRAAARCRASTRRCSRRSAGCNRECRRSRQPRPSAWSRCTPSVRWLRRAPLPGTPRTLPVLVYDADVARLRGWVVGGSGAMGLEANDPIATALALWEPWRHSCSSSSAPTLRRWSSARPSDAGRRSPSDSLSARRARE